MKCIMEGKWKVVRNENIDPANCFKYEFNILYTSSNSHMPTFFANDWVAITTVVVLSNAQGCYVSRANTIHTAF